MFFCVPFRSTCVRSTCITKEVVLDWMFLLLLHFADCNVADVQKFVAQHTNVRIEIVQARTTAYISPVPQQKNYNALIRLNGKGKKTSMGVTPQSPSALQFGTIAAARNIPYGTIMFVPKYGWGVVTDRGGAIKGNRLDLYCGKGSSAYKRAKAWGVQKTKIVRIIREEKKRSI